MLLAFLVMASTALCFLIVSSDRARVVRKEVTRSWHWMLLARSGRVPPASPPSQLSAACRATAFGQVTPPAFCAITMAVGFIAATAAAVGIGGG